MPKKSLKRAVWATSGVAAVLLAGVAQAALQDRDLNGDKVVDAFFDTDLNITWLRDADVNGLMHWDAAMRWVRDFSFAGYADWRLPTTEPLCQGWHCTDSEMGHLWYVELGNVPFTMTNKGEFLNLHSVAEHPYWSSTVDPSDPNRIWGFNMNYGGQGTGTRRSDWYAMAVRDGDVGAVPEPSGGLLGLLGLGLLAAMRQWRQRQHGSHLVATSGCMSRTP